MILFYTSSLKLTIWNLLLRYINKTAVFFGCLFRLLTHNNEKPVVVNLTCFVPPPHTVWRCIDGCVVLSRRDVMSLGITLVGHQKKIMSSIQTMRAQMLHLHGTGVQVWCTATGRLGHGGKKTNGEKKKQDLSGEQHLGRKPGIIVKVNGHLLCLTLPAVSGVKSFLCSSVKDCGPPLLKRALKRGKGQKTTTKKKRNYLDEMTYFSFFFLLLF